MWTFNEEILLGYCIFLEDFGIYFFFSIYFLFCFLLIRGSCFKKKKN